jgi:cytochrome c1
MIFIGDTLIPYEPIFNVKTVEEVSKTQANSTVLFTYNEELMQYCFQNHIAYGIKINTLKESLYANALRAKYIICEKEMASLVQKTAQNYLFDSKILAVINSNDEIEEIAQLEIDGVLYRRVLSTNNK